MAQFDVYRLKGGALALDCQSDQLDYLTSRFTVPLVDETVIPALIDGLHPRFDVGGVPMVMATHLAGAIPARAMTERVASLGEQAYVIQRALDRLTGF